MKVSDNVVVRFHYRLTNDNKELLDSSYDGEPLEYVHGHGQLIVGLEDKLTGLGVGEAFTVRVEPELAYGERSDEEKRRLVDKKDGLIGNTLLQNFKCVYDFPGAQFYLNFRKNVFYN